jgi:DNA-binding NtrC family response regulator
MSDPVAVLVADDEQVMRDSLAAWLREDGCLVDTAASGSEAIAKAEATDYAICFLDLKMVPGPDGIETLRRIRKLRPDAAVVIITAYATVDTAVTAMREGAHDYVVKPFNPEDVSLLVQRLSKLKRLERENTILRQKLAEQQQFQDIISKNPRMQAIFELVRDVANLRSTVLICGESGTGKEMVARAIHNSGERARGPFVAVSCAAFAETLLESEFFGHERGAFTGAVGRKKGKFELAQGGTIFLDEIGDITAKLQMDLLRVLQEKSLYRVGGTEEVQVDARVIAATKVDLAEAVRRGTFRDDLYYRLNVINVRIPALRERREDVPLLAKHFVARLSAETGKQVDDLDEGALAALLAYDWPGNVRELENAIERAIVTARKRVLSREDFAFLSGDVRPLGPWRAPTNVALDEVERQVIEATLARAGGNVKETARILGIDRSSLYDRIRRYGIVRKKESGN